MKTKTMYLTKGGQLLFDGKPTSIRVEDDYFFLDGRPLNMYQEDGQIFALKPLLPVIKWPMVSSPTGMSIDADGFLWARDKGCVFDQFLERT